MREKAWTVFMKEIHDDGGRSVFVSVVDGGASIDLVQLLQGRQVVERQRS